MQFISQFVKQSPINAPAEIVFGWHEQPMALERLTPPWERVTVLERTGGIRDGAKVKICQWMGPVPMVWEMAHLDYQAGKQFRDRMKRGPFAYWDHLHTVEPMDAASCMLIDEIHFKLPLHGLTAWAGEGFVQAKLTALFDYRHAITQLDSARFYQFTQLGQPPLTIFLPGSSFLIQKILIPFLSTQGHTVVTKLSAANREAVDVVMDMQEQSDDLLTLLNQFEISGIPIVHENIPFNKTNGKAQWEITESHITALYKQLLMLISCTPLAGTVP